MSDGALPMTTWFGVRPVWIAGPLLLYAAACDVYSEGEMGVAEAGFVLGDGCRPALLGSV
jgi:hypothetical protein